MCLQRGLGVPNLQTELNYLDSFKSYCIFSDFIVPTLSLWSPHCPHIVSTLSPCCPHIVTIIPMSSPLSPSSPHHLYGPHIIPTPTYPLHPPPPPRGGTHRISKNSIRFELIVIQGLTQTPVNPKE